MSDQGRAAAGGDPAGHVPRDTLPAAQQILDLSVERTHTRGIALLWRSGPRATSSVANQRARPCIQDQSEQK